MTKIQTALTVRKYPQQVAGIGTKGALVKVVMDTKGKVSFEGFSKRAEEICRGTSLMEYYFRRQQWQTNQ